MSSNDENLKDALRWRYLCNSPLIPIEFLDLLKAGASKETLDRVIDGALNERVSSRRLN